MIGATPPAPGFLIHTGWQVIQLLRGASGLAIAPEGRRASRESGDCGHFTCAQSSTYYSSMIRSQHATGPHTSRRGAPASAIALLVLLNCCDLNQSAWYGLMS